MSGWHYFKRPQIPERTDADGRVWWVLDDVFLVTDIKGRELIAVYSFDTKQFTSKGKILKVIRWREIA